MVFFLREFVRLSQQKKYHPFTLNHHLKCQQALLHGNEARSLRYIPKVQFRVLVTSIFDLWMICVCSRFFTSSANAWSFCVRREATSLHFIRWISPFCRFRDRFTAVASIVRMATVCPISSRRIGRRFHQVIAEFGIFVYFILLKWSMWKCVGYLWDSREKVSWMPVSSACWISLITLFSWLKQKLALVKVKSSWEVESCKFLTI
jgi:hypothetical protein